MSSAYVLKDHSADYLRLEGVESSVLVNDELSRIKTSMCFDVNFTFCRSNQRLSDFPLLMLKEIQP